MAQPSPPIAPTPNPKPGYRTTELAVTVLVAVGLLASALAGGLSPHWAAIATAISTGAYAISRGLAKNP